jgi:hypothetical protein
MQNDFGIILEFPFIKNPLPLGMGECQRYISSCTVRIKSNCKDNKTIIIINKSEGFKCQKTYLL